MIKKGLILFFSVFLVFVFCPNIYAADSREEARKEYLRIYENYLRSPKEGDYNKIVKELAIDKYEDFIKKYPESDLVDEAELRIAEFYSVIGQTWKAKKWLDDIIKNHPQGYHDSIKVNFACDGRSYSSFELLPLREKTAAWALYYRGAWFSKNRREDLNRVVKEYKDSEKPIRLSEYILRKIKK
ncbi:hypothetical protein KKB69_01100 [Patescibacteria group bacterium]|nr:hypothetical protein [Patescibacteria group bacterium]